MIYKLGTARINRRSKVVIIKLAEVRVGDNESIEAALRRFKREVLKAGIIPEVKKRKHFESPRMKKKRKAEEARRKASLANRSNRERNRDRDGGNRENREPRDIRDIKA